MGNINEMAGIGMPTEHAKAIVGTIDLAVTAAGTTTADATILKSSANLVTTGGSGTGVKLAASVPVGSEFRIYNAVANAILVYPPSGGEINGLGADTAASIAQDKGMHLVRLSSTQWGATFA